MADGTRLKTLDERLGVLEGRIAEFTTEFGKEKGEHKTQMGDMGKQIEGLGV